MDGNGSISDINDTVTTSPSETDCIAEDEHHLDEFACPLPDNEADKIVDCIVLSTFILIGVIGNLLLIVSIAAFKKMQKPQYYFILSIAIADLLVCAYVLPSVLSSRILDRNTFSPGHCIFNAFLSFACTGISNTSFSAIALNRYFFVTRRHVYNRVFTGRSTLAMVAIFWLLWCIYSGAAGATGNFSYLGDAYVCYNFDEANLFSATFMLALVGVLLPLCVSVAAYGAIFHRMYRVKSRLGESAVDTALSQDERKAIRAILVAFVMFNACWVPYLIQVITEKMDLHLSNMFHKYAVWLSLLNSSTNAIVYGMLNAEFRASYVRVLKCQAFKRRRRPGG